MNLKLIILIVAALAVLSVMIFIIQFLIRRIKNKVSTEGKLKISFGILFTTLFLTAAMISSKSIILFSEAIENIYKVNPENLMGEAAKTGLLFIGLTAVWFIIWYYIIKTLSIYITGKRIDEKEFESDNYSYFLIKGTLLMGFNLCLLPVFEIVVRSFMPSIQLPFYH